MWTREAFGESWGFLIIWIEWASFVVAWPGIMGTITLQAAYVADPDLQDNSLFLVVIVVAVTWLAALRALRGLRPAKALTWCAVIGGVILPTLIIVGLAVAWDAGDRDVQMATNPGALIPHFLDDYGASWLVPVFAALLVTGLAAALVQILGGPSRGLLVAARQGGCVPRILQRENAARMPVAIILLQATISSVLAVGYHLLGSVENA